MPIEEGFSIATGTGRAEIEFENGTILYLADNSVLEFNRLEDNFGVPITDVELVTGTATVNVRPAPRELFVMSTPSERLSFPAAALVRVDSFLDGVTATPENAAGDDVIEYGADAAPNAGTPITMNLNDVRSTVKLPAGLASAISDLAARNSTKKTHLNGGQPITYQNSKRVTDGSVANDSGAPSDWDSLGSHARNETRFGNVCRTESVWTFRASSRLDRYVRGRNILSLRAGRKLLAAKWYRRFRRRN